MVAIEEPNKSASLMSGPFGVESLISTVESIEPSVFINIMCTAPRVSPEPSSLSAPTAISLTPSPSKSPMSATDDPRLSVALMSGPFAVESLISTVESTEPSVFINIMCTSPLLLPTHDTQSAPIAPTIMSFTPSLFKSPMSAIEEPNISYPSSSGPFAVESLISSIESIEPSVFIKRMYTVPRLLPPVSSPSAPTAKSFTPSPSKSPMFAIDIPNLS